MIAVKTVGRPKKQKKHDTEAKENVQALMNRDFDSKSDETKEIDSKSDETMETKDIEPKKVSPSKQFIKNSTEIGEMMIPDNGKIGKMSTSIRNLEDVEKFRSYTSKLRN